VFRRRERPLPWDVGLARLVRLGVVVSVPAIWYEIAVLHFRGSFQSRPMWAPVLGLPAILVAGTRAIATSDERRSRDRFRPAAWLMAAIGVLGTLFHVRGVLRQMGGALNWRYNAVTGPPVPAPAQVALLGVLGAAASSHDRGGGDRWLVAQARAVNLASYALLMTEAGYSHWMGGFFNRVMWVPLLLSPVASAVHLGAMAGSGTARKVEGPISAIVAAAGLIGFAFHSRNVLTRPGGLSWQTLFYGAPVVAPLQLSSQGVLGVLTALFDPDR
jgi:hypothetical protein